MSTPSSSVTTTAPTATAAVSSCSTSSSTTAAIAATSSSAATATVAAATPMQAPSLSDKSLKTMIARGVTGGVFETTDSNIICKACAWEGPDLQYAGLREASTLKILNLAKARFVPEMVSVQLGSFPARRARHAFPPHTDGAGLAAGLFGNVNDIGGDETLAKKSKLNHDASIGSIGSTLGKPVKVPMLFMPKYWRDLSQHFHSNYQSLPDKEIRWIIYCVLCALVDCSKLSISHRDVKPDNILIPRGFCSPLSEVREAREAKEAKEVREVRETKSLTSTAAATTTVNTTTTATATTTGPETIDASVTTEATETLTAATSTTSAPTTVTSASVSLSGGVDRPAMGIGVSRLVKMFEGKMVTTTTATATPTSDATQDDKNTENTHSTDESDDRPLTHQEPTKIGDVATATDVVAAATEVVAAQTDKVVESSGASEESKESKHPKEQQQQEAIEIQAHHRVILTDFGNCCFLGTSEPGEFTNPAQTMWYRAPEILMSKRGKYSVMAESWSVGVLMAELFIGRPLFYGLDDVDQLFLIFKLLATHSGGVPTSDDLPGIELTSKYVKLVERLADDPRRDDQSLEAVLNSRKTKICPDAVDLITKLLVINPSKRLSLEAALSHPYFTGLAAPLTPAGVTTQTGMAVRPSSSSSSSVVTSTAPTAVSETTTPVSVTSSSSFATTTTTATTATASTNEAMTSTTRSTSSSTLSVPAASTPTTFSSSVITPATPAATTSSSFVTAPTVESHVTTSASTLISTARTSSSSSSSVAAPSLASTSATSAATTTRTSSSSSSSSSSPAAPTVVSSMTPVESESATATTTTARTSSSSSSSSVAAPALMSTSASTASTAATATAASSAGTIEEMIGDKLVEWRRVDALLTAINPRSSLGLTPLVPSTVAAVEKQCVITPDLRRIIVVWMLSIRKHLALNDATFFLACYYLDQVLMSPADSFKPLCSASSSSSSSSPSSSLLPKRPTGPHSSYCSLLPSEKKQHHHQQQLDLSEQPIHVKNVHLLGLACMLLASKIVPKNYSYAELEAYIECAKNNFTVDQLVTMEQRLAIFFDFQFFRVTEYTLLTSDEPNTRSTEIYLLFACIVNENMRKYDPVTLANLLQSYAYSKNPSFSKDTDKDAAAEKACVSAVEQLFKYSNVIPEQLLDDDEAYDYSDDEGEP